MTSSTRPDRAAGHLRLSGVIQPVSSMADFGNVLATHPLFADRLGAEALLLRQLLALRADDPEFQRIVSLFQTSG